MRLLLAPVIAGSVCPALLSSASASADEVVLKSGDTLTGEIVSSNEESVVLDHPTLGQITISQADIVQDPVATSEGEKAAQQAAEDFANWVDSWFFPGWEKSVAAGFSGTDGNSDTFSFYASVATGYEDDTDRWDINANYFLNYSDGDKEQNQFKAIAIKDWLLPDSDWFYWAQGTFQYDQFTDWETRAGLFGGIGYELIKGDVHTVLLRAGVGGQYEWGDINEFTPEAMAGIDWDWAISETQAFKFYNYLYPSLDPGFSEFRNLTGALYEVQLAAGNGFKLQLGVENEYNSEVAAGFDENDLKYFGALGFDF